MQNKSISVDVKKSENNNDKKSSIIVELFYYGDKIHLFVIHPDLQEPKIISRPLRWQDLSEMILNFLIGYHGNRTEARHKLKWLELSEIICEPLRPFLGLKDRIIFIPYSVFHMLPLHLLMLDGVPLIEKHPIVYVPSASVLRYCQRKNPARHDAKFCPQSIVSFGIDFEDEAVKVVNYFKQRQVFLNSENLITKDLIATACRKMDIIHFSCHGLYNFSQPELSGLLLDASMDIGITQRALLTYRDIYNLQLNSYLVTLGACNTGLSEQNAGDDLVGLVRGFLYAGTPTVIASLWPVPSEPTIALMESFYSHLVNAHMDKADALQAAQMIIRDQYPDPLNWAGFIVIGDWL